MLRNRLNELMAARSLKATRISADTGIARSTLSTVVNNDSKMLALDTINTLCEYLKVTPGDFFEYLPFDLTVKVFPNSVKVEDIGLNNRPGDKLLIKSVQMDLLLRQTSEMPGFIEHTFEFGVSLMNDAKLCVYQDLSGTGGVLVPPLVHDFSEIKLAIDLPKDANAQDVELLKSLWLTRLSAGFREGIINQMKKEVAKGLYTLIVDGSNTWLNQDDSKFIKLNVMTSFEARLS